ncbi:hypothetical protein QV01_01525 [Gallibacterium genomosp. 3]|uniref:Type I restriction modification DNA specificity domain-containing protein n=1 Tax=Gallibacterium genomosp. 3 TaxID=505345 RepID=A0A1A7NXG5_9PAST|nr:hypothetical protein QV01_01525 [Gallibacterium genomosp. 3]
MKYKDSGIDWIGEIPEGWEVLSNKYIFSVKKDVVGKFAHKYDLLSLTLRGIIKRDLDNPEGKFPAEFDSYQKVKKGDFIFCLFDIEETPRTVGLSDFDGMITGAYTIMEVSETFSKEYLYYLYLHLDNGKLLKPFYKGLRNTIPKDIFSSLKLPIPPLAEQQQIADFLDSKTALIDEAIGLKQQQIDKLKEYKQITIQTAVTRGLNPNAPMKNSGIDWIGEIPEHWEVKKLKFSTDINKYSLDENTPPNTVLKYVDIGSVTFENGIEKVEQYSFKNSPSRARRIAKVNSVVVSTVRTYLKATTLITEKFSDCIFSTGFAVLEGKIGIDYRYLSFFVKSDAFTIQVMLNSKGMSYPAINTSDLANIVLFIPPLAEQQQIADYLEQKSAEIDATITHYEQQIDKLKEYKTVLIQAAVTGRIKVSNDG